MSRLKLSTVQVALVAVFAAIQALLSSLPFAITFGVSGQITLGVIGGSLTGILLGPMTGGLAVLAGSLVGTFLNPGGAVFGILTIIPPSVGALSAGCVRIRRGYLAGILILASLLVFYTSPIGQEIWFYPWFPIVAMMIAFSPLALIAGSSFSSLETAKPVFGIAIAGLVGALADNMAGNAIGVWYYASLGSGIWYAAMTVYPIERIIATVLISVVASAVYYSLKKAGYLDYLVQHTKAPVQ